MSPETIALVRDLGFPAALALILLVGGGKLATKLVNSHVEFVKALGQSQAQLEATTQLTQENLEAQGHRIRDLKDLLVAALASKETT